MEHDGCAGTALLEEPEGFVLLGVSSTFSELEQVIEATGDRGVVPGLRRESRAARSAPDDGSGSARVRGADVERVERADPGAQQSHCHHRPAARSSPRLGGPSNAPPSRALTSPSPARVQRSEGSERPSGGEVRTATFPHSSPSSTSSAASAHLKRRWPSMSRQSVTTSDGVGVAAANAAPCRTLPRPLICAHRTEST